MAKLKFDFEWIDPAAAKGPELRATWARLNITVDDESVTRLVDQTSRSVRNGVFMPLYPVAEWFVTRWWFLLYEVERRGSVDLQSYEDRHCLRHAGEGFALPCMSFTPTGPNVRMQWRPIQLEHQGIEFTESGSCYTEAIQFRDSVMELVNAVVKRLHEYDIADTLLQEELEAITRTDRDEEDFCGATAALGLDPYHIDSSDASRILSVAAELPPSVLPEFFNVADFSHLQNEAKQLLTGIAASRSNPSDLGVLKELRQQTRIEFGNTQPWTQGYGVARQLRQQLRMNGAKLNSIGALGDALHIDVSELSKSFSFVLSKTAALDAVVDVNNKNSPGFALAKKSEPATLFAFCRGLFEYLAAPDSHPLIVTRSRSERQKRNRAFAAEFLVPAEALREVLPEHDLTYEDVDDLAEQFGVSAAVIRHQIENHGLAS